MSSFHFENRIEVHAQKKSYAVTRTTENGGKGIRLTNKAAEMTLELFGTKISIPNTCLHFNGFLGIAPQPKSRDVASSGLIQ